MMMPMISVSANVFRTSPPRKKSAMTTSIVAPEVRIVRDSVWLIERLMTASSGSFLGVLQVLADPVVDDDRVVDGVADEGQERGHDDEVELAAEEREQPDRDQRVVDRGATIAPTPKGSERKRQRDVDEHADRRRTRPPRAPSSQVRADLRARRSRPRAGRRAR